MIDINHELSQNFLDFSYEANSQRAFADARDGLKPGQRACLWEMYSKGYNSSKPHVKSAKVSGGVIASWWPHSNAAIYDTFARMSQNWINNIPEVDWHGANGSVQISGEAAAERYTECRLAKSSEDGLFCGIKKNNVSMKLNFSEDEEWPEVLPAIYPRLLVNGCQGIGSTIANTWLPMALDEVAKVINQYLNTGEIDYNGLAPSFPSGGIIINRNELSAIYKTGKGKVVLRGKAEIRGNRILITEIPYQVYVEPLIDSIKDLIVKGELTDIADITNKSNKNQLLIEIECDNNPELVLSKLYQKTDLQKSFNANQYALVGKTPKLLTFKEYLDIFLNHNYECINREYLYDLEKSKQRLEIVEGLLKALEDIDNIIQLIKHSESAKAAVDNLIKQYQFTENQAQAIVNMKLGRLAHLEYIELTKEKQDLINTINKCNDVIAHLDRKKEIYIKRFNDFVKKYPNPQRTELTQIDIKKETTEEPAIEPEKCVVISTKSGLIKRVPVTSFKPQTRNTVGTKSQDDIASTIIRTNTVDSLMIFTNKAKMYRLSVNDIPVGTNTSRGQSIKALIEMAPDEKPEIIYSIYKDTQEKYVVFITKQGLIKRTALDDFVKTKRANGIAATTFNEGDSLASVFLATDEDVFAITKEGMGIRFSLTEVTPTSRAAKGIKGVGLHEGDEVRAAVPIRDESDDLGIFSEQGYAKRIPLSLVTKQKRGGKGLSYGKTDIPAAVVMLAKTDNVLIVGDRSSLCIKAADIAETARSAVGIHAIKNNKIIGVSKV